MQRRKALPTKKHFTPEQANRMLPLVRAIVADIVSLVQDLQQRQERLSRIRPNPRLRADDVYLEECRQMQQELAKDAARVEELHDELRELGVELKGYDGLVDFPSQLEGREVYLCWKLGEAEVSHWHELDAGFAGRQKLMVSASSGSV